MRTLTTTLLTLLTLTLHAQFDFNRNGFLEPKFHFVMRFEDAKGNRDSVVFGLDDRLYFPISWPESVFGQNPITTPYDSIFEVRAGVNPAYKRTSKIVISGYESALCNPNIWTSFPPILRAIAIHAKYYPVKISWDSTLFNTTCYAKISLYYYRNYSLIAKMRNQQSCIFRENPFPFTTEEILLQNGKTANAVLLYLAFQSENIVPTYESAEVSPIHMYPNPAQNMLHIEDASLVQSLCISDALGHVMFVQEANDKSGVLDVSMLPEGLYFIKTIGTDNRIHIQKICIAR